MKEFLERLKAMPTWQKVVLVLAVLATIGIALYVRNKNSRAQATTTPLSSGLLNGTGKYDIYGNPLYGNQTPGSSGGITVTPGAGPSGNGYLGPPQKKPPGGYQQIKIPNGATLQQEANQYFGGDLSKLLALNNWAKGYDPALAGNVDGQALRIA